jgi:uncharacterized glyoxalase superfamily protein PhnB
MTYNPRDGYPALMPGLRYDDLGAALEWLHETFGIHEHLRWVEPETGKVRHAEMRAGDDGYIELSDNPENGILVFVDDVDAHFERARAAGAKIESEPADQPWGLRQYTARDLEGNLWGFAMHVRDVGPSQWGAQLAEPSPEPRFVGMVPYLHVRDADASLAWYAKVFGFETIGRWERDGVVHNAEMRSGRAEVWLDGGGVKPPAAGEWIGVWVDDVNAMYERVRSVLPDVAPPQDKPYGIRTFQATDPDGYVWGFMRRIG